MLKFGKSANNNEHQNRKPIHREPKPQNRKSQGPRPRAVEKLLDGDVTDKKN